MVAESNAPTASQAQTGKQPFWATCRACGHCWVVAYVPMAVEAFCRLASRAACPRCAADRPYVASAEDVARAAREGSHA